ncbi:MAG: tetratricopeptide repeat protein [Desulfobacterales bacterium]|nr:tetratricopeptide repeat protein [Desulfobacterales bacterium]
MRRFIIWGTILIFLCAVGWGCASRLDKALNIAAENPDDAVAQNNLGILYEELGRIKEAMAAYQRAMEIKPDYVDAHYNFGVVCGAHGRNEIAFEQYKLLKDLDPSRAEEFFDRVFN